MTRAKDQNTELAAVKNQLDALKAGDGDDANCHCGEFDKNNADNIRSQDWFKAMSAAGKQAFENYWASQNADSTGTNIVPKNVTQTLSDAMANEMSANSSANELQMIKLQSAISSRGQMLQLVSNMISAFHDTQKSIIGNTRA
jgi:hypothetical protein